MIGKTYKSFRDALNGLKIVATEERNFKIEIFFSILVLLLAFYFGLTFIEKSVLILCIVLVLAGEIINTAVEDICNKIEPNEDNVIGKIKDIMAAYVLVSVFGAVIVGLLIFINHFYTVFSYFGLV